MHLNVSSNAGVRTRAPLRRIGLLSAIALVLVALFWTAGPAPAAATPTVARTQELAVIVSRADRDVEAGQRLRTSRLGRAHAPDHRRANRAPGDRPPNRRGWDSLAPGQASRAPEQQHRLDQEGQDDAFLDGLAPRRRSLGAATDRVPQRPDRASVLSGHRQPLDPDAAREYFVEETVLLTDGQVGAPYALALSARSYVLQEFAGGPGQIAVHGVWNVGGRMGTAVSHGCVRLDTASITWLGERIGPGVPVTITSLRTQISQAPSRWTTSPSTLSSPPGRRSLTMSQCTALSFLPPVYV